MCLFSRPWHGHLSPSSHPRYFHHDGCRSSFACQSRLASWWALASGNTGSKASAVAGDRLKSSWGAGLVLKLIYSWKAPADYYLHRGYRSLDFDIYSTTLSICHWVQFSHLFFIMAIISDQYLVNGFTSAIYSARSQRTVSNTIWESKWTLKRSQSPLKK